MSARHDREKAFHDQAFSEQTRARVWGIYNVADAGERAYRAAIANAAAPGAAVLEYGCGMHASAFALADRGAHVTGIDISDVAIANARHRAEAEGVAVNTDFTIMDAEAMDFPDGEFDLICGSGILHHLELRTAFGEIARTLKPDGRAIFLEPLGHNSLINAYRRRTPELRTADEHPLRMADLELAGSYFGSVRKHFFALATLAAIPLKRRGPRRTVAALEAVDRLLFRTFPPIRRHAWLLVLELADPRPAARFQ